MTPGRLVTMQAMVMCVGLLFFSVTWAAPMLSEKDSIINKGSTYGDLTASMCPEPTGDKGAENAEDSLPNLPDQGRYGATFIRSITQPTKRPVTRLELWRVINNEKKPKSVPSIIPADVNDGKDRFKDEKNQQRYLLSGNSPVESKRAHQLRRRRSTHYLTYLPQVRKIPSDFEGSGSPDPQVRGDNDVPAFSGDGQRFTYISGKGGAVGPGLESSASHVGGSGSDRAEIVNPHTRGLGSNEIPERERHGDGTNVVTRDKTAQGAAGVSFVEGSNDITGNTNFRGLPGKEGNRIDTGSQNAHQGRVEFHYPPGSSKEKLKDDLSDTTGRARVNEIPKHTQTSSRKDTGEPYRNQVTSSEKQRFPGKSKSQGLLLPSHSLGNDIKSRGGSSNIPSSEGIITHSRKNNYVLRGQNNSTWNKGMSPRRRAWPSRRPHAHRRYSMGRRDSSESSSGSSSQSDGE